MHGEGRIGYGVELGPELDRVERVIDETNDFKAQCLVDLCRQLVISIIGHL